MKNNTTTISNEEINTTIESLKIRKEEAQAQASLTLDVVKSKIIEINENINDVKTKRIIIAYLVSIITRQSKTPRLFPCVKPTMIKNACNNLFNTNYTTDEINETLLTCVKYKFITKNGFFNGLLLEEWQCYDPQIAKQENQKQIAKSLNVI